MIYIQAGGMFRSSNFVVYVGPNIASISLLVDLVY